MTRIVYSSFTSPTEGSTEPILTSGEIADLSAAIDAILADDVLSSSEKSKTFVPKIDELNQLTDNLLDRAASLGVNNTALTTAQTNFMNYLESLTPAWDNAELNTNISRSTLNNLLSIYTNEIAILQTSIQGLQGPPGTPGVQGPPGANGAPTYVWFAYANNSDGTQDFTLGESEGRLYMGVAPNKNTPTESTNPAFYTWSLIRGTDGIPGPPGANGLPTYIWLAYANSADGTQDFTTGEPESRTYMGIAPNKNTATESTNPALYTWSKIQGATGPAGPPGTPGEPGPPGPSGGGDALAPSLSSGLAVVPAYADGTVINYDGAITTFTVRNGSNDVSSDFTLSVLSNPNALTHSINQSTKTVTFTGGLDANEEKGIVVLRMTGNGGTPYSTLPLDMNFSVSKLKGGFEIVPLGSALPTTDLDRARIVLNQNDGKLYRTSNGLWISSTSFDDLIGEIDYQQIGDGAVRLQHLLITPNNLNPDPRFLDNDLWYVDNATSGVGSGLLGQNFMGWFADDVIAQPGVNSAIVGSRFLNLWSGQPGQNNNAQYYVYSVIEKNNQFRVTPEKVYEFSAGCQNFTNQYIYVIISWLTEAGTYIDDYGLAFSPGQSLVKSEQITAPPGAAIGHIVIANSSAPTLSGAAYVGNIDVKETIGATLLVDGILQARHATADLFTGDKFEAGFITAAQGAFTELSSITSHLGVINAGTLQSFNGNFKIDLGLGRTVTTNGTIMTVTGIGFGSSNQFLEWTGPFFTNLSLCTEGNAIRFLKTNGDAYFGGSLSAGILRNSVGTSLLSVGHSVPLGPFGTNGNPRVVVTSYNSQVIDNSFEFSANSTGLSEWKNTVTNWGGTYVGNDVDGYYAVGTKQVSINAAVQTTRNIGSSILSTLIVSSATETISGNSPAYLDVVNTGQLTITRTSSGSVTTTDNTTGVEDRVYTATLSSNTGALSTFFNGPGTSKSQSVYITSTEE